MAAESLVKAMRNETKNTSIPDYYDMDEANRQKVHNFFCANTNVTFEESHNNRTSLIKEK